MAEVFSFYFDELQEILQLASAQHDGRRPESLSNEVYSCFHHLARGLCARSTVRETLSECDKAVNSHLKRAALDSYKLAIHAFLRADTKLKEVLDYLVLVEDYEKYVPDGIVRINEINTLGAYVREQLRLAKRHEAQGDYDSSIDCFNAAVEKATELSDRIRAFTDNQTFLLACAREARERKERKKDRQGALLAAVISAVVSAILTAICTLAIQDWIAK